MKRKSIFGDDDDNPGAIKVRRTITEEGFNFSNTGYVSSRRSFNGFGNVPIFRRNKWDTNIDKQIINISRNLTGTQSNLLMFTATQACTVFGFLFQYTVRFLNNATLRWVITVVPEGYTPSAIDSGSNDFYSPVKEVILFGLVGTDLSTHTFKQQHRSDIAMKLKKGDKIYFSGIQGNCDVRGSCMFFIRYT